MEPQFIIISGSSMPFIAESEDYKRDKIGPRWIGWYYQSGAYLFNTKDDAHAVAKELELNTYSLLESYSKVSS